MLAKYTYEHIHRLKELRALTPFGCVKTEIPYEEREIWAVALEIQQYSP